MTRRASSAECVFFTGQHVEAGASYYANLYVIDGHWLLVGIACATRGRCVQASAAMTDPRMRLVARVRVVPRWTGVVP